ncbi:MAG: hypothetical protein J1E34_08070 [Oscillospiraceae bacterium]|nr:hypothetical protein [Oscillospiraceae bacterium]
MQEKQKKKSFGIGVLAVLLVLCELASLSVLFSRISSYSQREFVNVMSLTENSVPGTGNVQVLPPSESSESNSGGSNPQFVMEAEVEIFKFTYDETGKITVVSAPGTHDKLIAPGTSNIYQFTLANTGNVALDYTMTMESYITGTDLWLPVYSRVWDYTNRYLLGSPEDMADVLELNSVRDFAELGAGRNAVYSLEWEWPFEWGNDEYDTMLGNLAVDNDLVLTVIIKVYAEYDEEPDDPNSGLLTPPNTGDDSQIVLLAVLCGGSFVGVCVMIFAFVKSKRKEEQAEKNE